MMPCIETTGETNHFSLKDVQSVPQFGWTRHMIRTILVLSFDLCVHFFMVFLCLSHKQKLQEHFPLFIGLLILFEITYKLTIYEYIPLNLPGKVNDSISQNGLVVSQSEVGGFALSSS